ncbi:Oxidoreductase [Lachnellula subtilissima]|uniref:Oxidoreductase n=1 Tax=Lachnellula subtilissima TaxID=602034 RepID=A0A8H8UDQ0_9HELO|nr:Oxidoreductase [Lachnellula subtilissima]
MVSLSAIRTSNSLIKSTFPAGLVAVFIGATNGIGEVSLKTFAKYTHQPRAYFVGLSQDAGDRIAAECKALNPGGEYIFKKADVSLIRVVDEVCEEIKKKEKCLNILFLSAGVLSMDRSETSEHVHLLASLNYYSRMRFIGNLLPLLKEADTLRRVITVAGGGKEGPLDTTDLPALRVPLPQIRGHLCSLITLGLETVVMTAPDVSFVHDYPGTVLETALWRGKGGPPQAAIDTLVPIEESGERHLYLATSAKYPSLVMENAAVQVGDGDSVALDTRGKVGGGLYSIGWDCEDAAPLELLAKFRAKDMVKLVWQHTESEFTRIGELSRGM